MLFGIDPNLWSNHQRILQYFSTHATTSPFETINPQLSIDSDVIDGPVATLGNLCSSFPKPDPDPITVDDNCGTGFTMTSALNDDTFSASCSATNCRGGGTHWTYNNTTNTPDDTCKWTPNLPQAGYYDVYADVTDGYATTTGAVYHIHHSGGEDTTIVNQNANGVGSYGWVKLGTFVFDSGQNDYVYLNDVVPEKNTSQVQITCDAISWNYVKPATLQGNFDSADCSAFQGWVWDPNSAPNTSTQVELDDGNKSLGTFTGSSSIGHCCRIQNEVKRLEKAVKIEADSNIIYNK